MCVIIDSCCIPSVFDASSAKHHRFMPMLRWVTLGEGKIVYGGTKYRAELSKLHKYLRMFAELSRQRRAIQIPDREIDDYAEVLKTKVPDGAFNDEHIVAIVAISGCRVVCTEDKESHPYLLRRDLYPKYVKPPKIYSQARHRVLCCDKNLASFCKKITELPRPPR